MSHIERPSLEDIRILCYPDKRLRMKAAPLAEVDGFLGELAHRMDEIMLSHEGVGLAATQIGWPRQFIVVNPTMEPGKSMALINPVIVERDGRVSQDEGCLSVPGIRSTVSRADYVKIRARLLTGEEVEMEGEGLMARLFQHEIDHLEGRLFVDRVGAAGRVLLARRLKRLAQRQDPSDPE
ncbi:MAG TPA: peptide deformylase [Candidatus Brocadiia bacterium]|nr:peptide deformylase [Candidatus Brocadiia bacterium]